MVGAATDRGPAVHLSTTVVELAHVAAARSADPALAPGSLVADPTALLAVAAAVIVASRQLLGLTTLGTFAPALLALAAIDAGREGLPEIGFVLALGVAVTPVLRLARLPRVARLGTTVAVLSAATIALDGEGASALPLVAVVAVVERLVELVERSGARDAARVGVLTLVAAGAAYLAATTGPVVGLAARQPLATSLAAGASAALIGCYRGLRLAELWRFRDVGAATSTETSLARWRDERPRDADGRVVELAVDDTRPGARSRRGVAA